MDAIEIGEQLMSAAKKAADLLESLQEKSDFFMQNASVGVLADGTPVEDILAELKELKQDHAKSLKLLYEVRRKANECSSASAFATIKDFRIMLRP